MNLNKKEGPLPLWGWGLGGIVAIYLYYRYTQDSSSSSTSQDAAALNDGTDPVTGVPYADEEAAYENEGASAITPDTSTDSGTDPYEQENQDLIGLLETYLQGNTKSGETNGRSSTGKLLHAGAIQAPYGSTAPPPKNGYTVVGTGGGNWQYVPDSLVTTAGGYIYGSLSRAAPVVAAGEVAKGLGGGLWEIIPKPKAASTPKKPKPKPSKTTGTTRTAPKSVRKLAPTPFGGFRP